MYVISARPDLVTAGDARVAIAPVKRVKRTKFTIRLNGRNVSRTFARRATGRYEGLLTGLRVGRNVLTARGPGRRTGRLVITNHPNGGPVFSGPQLGNYRCQEGAVDAQCNQPATATLLYKSTNPLKSGLQPYDRSNPPSDVARTTTDQGVRVPFVVLREDGYQDRDRYAILTLFQPGRRWTPWKPQPQFNGKILIPHGGNCGSSYTPGSPPLADYSGTLPEETPGLTPSYLTALGRGFGVISTALANTGHNCSVAMNAESLLMAKERFVERYGTIRYTIGTGCSGGSIAQHTVANAYPGIYQGLVTTCSYPDTMTAGAQFADYHLLRQYFEDPTRWGPGVVWTPLQFAQVEGHVTHLNAVVADEGLYKAALNPEHACPGTLDTVAGDPSTRYDDETNPAGVRCSVLDTLINQLGPRPESVWGAEEQAAGHGFGGVPFANAGVLYGLEALRENQITTAQFVDLNEAIGGLDVDSRRTDQRTAGDPGSVALAYRTGLVNEANHLDQVAMLNFGGPDPGIAHDYAHAFWTEERLAARPGPHRQPRDVVRPDAADRRPPLGQRGAGVDGPLAAGGRAGSQCGAARAQDRDAQACRPHGPVLQRARRPRDPGRGRRGRLRAAGVAAAAPLDPARDRRRRRLQRPALLPAASAGACRRGRGAPPALRRAVDPPPGGLPRRRLRLLGARHRAGPRADLAHLHRPGREGRLRRPQPPAPAPALGRGLVEQVVPGAAEQVAAVRRCPPLVASGSGAGQG